MSIQIEQDDNGDFSNVNMDTAVAIRTLEETYRSSADASAVQTMIHRLTERVNMISRFHFYSVFICYMIKVSIIA